MNTGELSNTLTTLFGELVNGAPKDGAYMLNAGDEGLLRSLDKLSAQAASALTPTGSSIAAHADHLRYGLSLMNRWSAGENPFGTADWSTSWKKTTVSDEEWRTRRAELRAETSRWLVALRSPRDVQTIELNGMIGTIAHLAYHLGAIRQIDQGTRGPKEVSR
jgi:hypothetical protein